MKSYCPTLRESASSRPSSGRTLRWCIKSILLATSNIGYDSLKMHRSTRSTSQKHNSLTDIKYPRSYTNIVEYVQCDTVEYLNVNWRHCYSYNFGDNIVGDANWLMNCQSEQHSTICMQVVDTTPWCLAYNVKMMHDHFSTTYQHIYGFPHINEMNSNILCYHFFEKMLLGIPVLLHANAHNSRLLFCTARTLHWSNQGSLVNYYK